jgi:hypothetical protein
MLLKLHPTSLAYATSHSSTNLSFFSNRRKALEDYDGVLECSRFHLNMRWYCCFVFVVFNCSRSWVRVFYLSEIAKSFLVISCCWLNSLRFVSISFQIRLVQLSTTLLTPFAKFCRSSQEDHWERVRRGTFPCFSLKLLSSSCCPFISAYVPALFQHLAYLDRSTVQAFFTST